MHNHKAIKITCRYFLGSKQGEGNIANIIEKHIVIQKITEKPIEMQKVLKYSYYNKYYNINKMS